MRKNEAVWIDSRQRWQINVQVEGERRTFTSSIANSQPGNKKGKIEAEKKADKWIENQLVGENTRVEILLDKFLVHVKIAAGSSTYRQNEKFIRLYVKPVVGKKKISRLTSGDLQDVIELSYHQHELSQKTLKGIRGCITSWLKYCRLHSYTNLRIDPLTIPKGAKRSSRTILCPAALETVFSVSTTQYRGKLREEPYIWAYRFAVLTGLRPGEVIGLLNANITAKTYEVTQSINEDGETTPGKNENANRVAFIEEEMAWALSEQKKMLRRIGVISKYVFPDTGGDFISQKRYWSHWKRYCAANGITEGTKPYELRHTWVSVNDEMPDGLKKLIMGHSKNMDTTGVYGHEKEDDRARAAAYSDAAFKRYINRK